MTGVANAKQSGSQLRKKDQATKTRVIFSLLKKKLELLLFQTFKHIFFNPLELLEKFLCGSSP